LLTISELSQTAMEDYTVGVKSKTALETGSCGLIRSTISVHMAEPGFQVFGLGNNPRAAIKAHCPGWEIAHLCRDRFREIVRWWQERLAPADSLPAAG